MSSFISNLSTVEILIFLYLYAFCAYATQAMWYKWESRTRWNWRLFLGTIWPVAHIVYAVVSVAQAILDADSARKATKRKAAELARRPPLVS